MGVMNEGFLLLTIDCRNCVFSGIEEHLADICDFLI